MKRSVRFPKHSLAPSLALTVLLVAWTSAAFARQVRANIERILAEYEIEDKSTLKEFKGTLLAMELLAGNDDAALALIEYAGGVYYVMNRGDRRAGRSC